MKNGLKTLAVWLIIGVILMFLIPAVINNSGNKLTYSELIERIETGAVSEISIEYGGETATVKLKNDQSKKTVNIPDVENLLENVNKSMKDNSIKVTMEDEPFLLDRKSVV